MTKLFDNKKITELQYYPNLQGTEYLPIVVWSKYNAKTTIDDIFRYFFDSKLAFDPIPVEGSPNLLTSGTIYTALTYKVDKTEFNEYKEVINQKFEELEQEIQSSSIKDFTITPNDVEAEFKIELKGGDTLTSLLGLPQQGYTRKIDYSETNVATFTKSEDDQQLKTWRVSYDSPSSQECIEELGFSRITDLLDQYCVDHSPYNYVFESIKGGYYESQTVTIDIEQIKKDLVIKGEESLIPRYNVYYEEPDGTQTLGINNGTYDGYHNKDGYFSPWHYTDIVNGGVFYIQDTDERSPGKYLQAGKNNSVKDIETTYKGKLVYKKLDNSESYVPVYVYITCYPGNTGTFYQSINKYKLAVISPGPGLTLEKDRGYLLLYEDSNDLYISPTSSKNLTEEELIGLQALISIDGSCVDLETGVSVGATDKVGVITYNQVEEIGDSINNLQVTQQQTNVLISGTKNNESNISLSIPAATSELSGVMTNNDKQRLDNVYNANMRLVTPVITGNWFISDSTGEPIDRIQDANINVVKGCRVRWMGQYKWTQQHGYKNPTRCGSNSNWSDLPEDDTWSSVYSQDNITTNTTIRAVIEALKTGLMVNGTDVIPARGYDSTQATCSVTFKDLAYYGKIQSANISQNDFSSLTKMQVTTKTFHITNVSLEENEYFVYVYPASYGQLSTITEGGVAAVLGAFNMQQITSPASVNDAKVTVQMYAYVTNHPGAFTNAILDFK